MGWSRMWVLAAVVGLGGGVLAGGVEMEWVVVADHRNPNDNTGFGSVASIYEIGKYEVTAVQYTAFLNAVAATDLHGLYSADMWMSPYPCGIERHGTPGAYTYTVAPDYANRPVRHVSFWDACRFANWLNNNGGSTETGAYALNNITNPDNASVVRRSGAKVFLPTLNEWYKAAYYDGQAKWYYDYATGADTMPGLTLVDPDPGNSANYSMGLRQNSVGPPYWASEVGAFENSASPYGTFDQSGNVWGPRGFPAARAAWPAAGLLVWGRTSCSLPIVWSLTPKTGCPTSVSAWPAFHRPPAETHSIHTRLATSTTIATSISMIWPS